jgi:hypothetical protein
MDENGSKLLASSVKVPQKVKSALGKYHCKQLELVNTITKAASSKYHCKTRWVLENITALPDV